MGTDEIEKKNDGMDRGMINVNIDTEESMLSFRREDECPDEEVFYRRWDPPSGRAPKGIVHISHGMAEHSRRYDTLARALASNGFSTFCADQRGHGKTGVAYGIMGHHPKGFPLMVSDIIYMLKKWKAELPNIPVFLFGHSMGSILASHAAMEYEVDSLILSGCPNATVPGFLLFGYVCQLLKFNQADGFSSIQPTVCSKKWDGLVSGTTENRFISTNVDAVNNYNRDEWCGHDISNLMWQDMYMFMVKQFATPKRKDAENKMKNTKIWLFAGQEDHCAGVNGISLMHVSKLLEAYAGKRPKITLYDGRHEVLNEKPRVAQQCINDIVAWINTFQIDEQQGKSKL